MINTTKKIAEAFTAHLKPSNVENEYNPTVRVQSTVRTSKNGFNEVFEHIHNQLKQKYDK